MLLSVDIGHLKDGITHPTRFRPASVNVHCVKEVSSWLMTLTSACTWPISQVLGSSSSSLISKIDFYLKNLRPISAHTDTNIFGFAGWKGKTRWTLTNKHHSASQTQTEQAKKSPTHHPTTLLIFVHLPSGKKNRLRVRASWCRWLQEGYAAW